LFKPSDGKSDEHPCVILVTNAERDWFEHAFSEHNPVNQVLIEPTAEAEELPRKIGTNPPTFRH
jgi:hypothetical protein